MRRITEFILEKLKVSNNNRSYDVTLESLTKALKDYKERNHIYAVYIDLKNIFEKYPEVLQYHGTYTDKNIIGEKIGALGYAPVNHTVEKLVFVYFERHIGDSKGSVRIENTEELNDIFGEEALDKIYDYIITH